MKTKFKGILTLLLALVAQVAFAQQTVTGTVSDADGPVLGASVQVKGTNNATTTDFDGKYSLSVSAEDTLVFSYAGYETQEVAVGNQSVINITLSPAELDQVLVIGYRDVKPTRSSVAVSTVTSETIENRPNASFVQTLSGQVAGLNIATNSGQPGANSTVQIRGINSVNGNTEPLFIIDGAPVDEDNFRSLNPQDIASVSVLKDAGATAIYGNRGANGVVVIKTKGGRRNQPLQISANSIISFTELQDNDYRLMSSPEQLRLEREVGNGRGVGLTDAEIDATPTTNWDEVFFRTGTSQQTNVQLTSGGKNSSQFTSFGYTEQEGVLVQSKLKRFNVRNNVSGSSENGKFTYDTRISAGYSVNDEPNAIGTGGVNRNYILGAYQSLPYFQESDYVRFQGGDIAPFLSNTPLLLLDRLATYERTEEELKFVGSATFRYNFAKNLTLASVTGIDYQNEVLLRYEDPRAFNSAFFAGVGEDLAGTQDQQTNRQFSINQTTSITYNNSWDKHSLTAGLYTEYFKAHFRGFGFRQQGIDIRTHEPGDGGGFVPFNAALDFYDDIANATKRDAGLFSYFGSADYDYDERFGGGITVRRDATYRFSGSNRWATFYSVSGRWNLDKEKFMEGSDINALKLRVSYGQTGNQRIVDGGYFTAPDNYRTYFDTINAYNGINSISLYSPVGIAGNLGNTDLRWETVNQFNVGLDFGVWSNRLRGSLDFYSKKTEDLFLSQLVSGLNGTYSIPGNTGNLFNRGIDLEPRYNILQGQNDGLKLELGVNLNYNVTELDNLPAETGEIPGTGRNGGILFEYFAVRTAGVNPANGELLFLDADGNLTENPDLDLDRTWLDKNIYPDVQGSFTLNADYKNFYLQTQFNFTLGRWRFDGDYQGFVDPDDIGTFRHSRDILRAWTPDNRITDIPSLTASNRNLGSNDRFLRDADFLRMRFAQFGYNFKKDMLDKVGLSKLNVFVNAENLFTITEWRGYDVEAQSNTSLIYPTPRIISVGLEIGL